VTVVDENDIIERRACISGVGQSDIGRRLFRDPFELTLDGCLAAIEHAGLTTDDIDGVSTYPGPMGTPAGFSGAGAYDVMDALRLKCGWYGSGLETSGQLGSVVNACLAVASGLANHVLCFRSVYEGSAQGEKGRAAVMPGGGGGGGGGFKASGFMEWNLPFAAPSAAIWIAMFAQRHFHQYGTTREQLAWIALNARRNAVVNPKAIYRDPMSMDDYMAARMISSPFCLYDCDIPCDGATAVIVSRRDRAKDLRNPALRVEAVGTRIDGRPSWDQFDDLSTMTNRAAGKQLWERTEYQPSDVQMAQLYDGFSWITMSWLEALGLCGLGESGPFIEGGTRIARDGQLPLNTHGGQLSAGRLHGYGFLHEGATQMWGQAGERQIATPPEVGVIAAGGGNTCGCLLLVRE
jgi:acetyl-CoA acetyltransferase